MAGRDPVEEKTRRSSPPTRGGRLGYDCPMASDDKPKPALPPMPKIGGSEDASAPRIAPPKIGKAEARKVGIDTSFIDGLTAGLMDEVPGVDPQSATPVAGEDTAPAKQAETDTSDDTSSAPATSDDDFEQLMTRALPAMDEDGNVAKVEKEADEQATDDKASGTASSSSPPRATQVAGEVRTSPAESPIPRSWWMVGAAAGLMSLAVLWKVCGGADVSAPGDGDDRVAALERGDEQSEANEHGGGAAHADGASEIDEHAQAGGGGQDQADAEGSVEGSASPADAEDPEQAEGDARAAGDEDETEGDEHMQIDLEDGAADGDTTSSPQSAQSSRGGAHKPLPVGEQSADRAAEDAMTAEELLRAAKEAYAKGKARDAYRLANLSNQKAKSDDALEVKAKAACRMKNKDLAKSAYKNLPLGEKRREVRQTCRENEIRLGL
jgi:hypothetical protein